MSSTCYAFSGCGAWGLSEKWKLLQTRKWTNLINARVHCLSIYISQVIQVPFFENFAIPWTSLQQ